MPEDHGHHAANHAALPDQTEPARAKLVRAKHAASLIVLRIGSDAVPLAGANMSPPGPDMSPASVDRSLADAGMGLSTGGSSISDRGVLLSGVDISLAKETASAPAMGGGVVCGTGEPHMLMGMRGARHRFMPNRLVFPGGRVDRADLDAAAATPLSAPTERALRNNANARLARGLALAAARELLEETGLSLGSPPRLHGLHYLARAVTPPANPIRFNARFFVVSAQDVTGSIGGDGELEGLRFYAMTEALALDLALPTRRVLERLRAWLAMTEAERDAQTHTPVLLRDRGWRME